MRTFFTKEADLRFAEAMRKIAGDLFSLEVNTILKMNMTAQKMPLLPHALIDIVRVYDGALRSCERHYHINSDGQSLTTASWSNFHALRVRAHLLLQHSDDDTASHYYLLYRIKDNCDQLKGIFNQQGLQEEEFSRENADAKAESLALPYNQFVVIRKMWEIGTEEIMLQTVIQIDGDVITRIHPDCLQPEKQVLLHIHHDATNTATSFWATLIKLIGTFVGNLTGYT